MDIFGKKKISDLEYKLKLANENLKQARTEMGLLRKPYDEYKNRFRSFRVFATDGTNYDIKARRFDYNQNGYYFYEVDSSHHTSVHTGYSYTSEGNLIAHISSRSVWRVQEITE